MKPLRLVLILALFPVALFASRVRVQLVQFPIEGNRTLDQFWKKVERDVALGLKQKAEVIVFPELMSLDLWPIGKGTPEKQVVSAIAENADEIIRRAGALAAKHKVLLVAGSTPRKSDGKLFNTAIIAKPSGEVVLQNKTHLTRWEKETGFTGGEEIFPIRMPWGTFVVLTCYESEIPVLSEQLSEFHPELFIIPSMTDDRSGLRRVRFAAQARSLEHLAYVALTGTVGKPSRKFPNEGQAVFLAPPVAPFRKPTIEEGALNRAQSIFSTLDFDRLQQAREKPPVYPAKDQRRIRVEAK